MKKTASRKRLVWGLIGLLLLVASLGLVVTRYKLLHFGTTRADEIIFYLHNGAEGGNLVNFRGAVVESLPWLLLILLFLSAPLIDFYQNKVAFDMTIGRGRRATRVHFNPSKIRLKYKLGYAVLVCILSLGYLVLSFGVYEYMRLQLSSSNVFEKHYVDPAAVLLTFPEKKRNLVYIFLESMEGTVGSKQRGGASNVSYIPELESLAAQHTAFSNTSLPLGGAYALTGATWTVGAMTAQSGGVPLENSLGIGHNDMGTVKQFLPGMYTLGDILHNAGYTQELLIGSDAAFGGRDKLYKQHGDYAIFDYEAAKKTGKVHSDYKTWWGFEDKKLFTYAKEEVTRLAGGKAPFNVQLLTADTHFTDGYLDPSCPKLYGQQYENVYACSSKMVSEFVEWLQQQPFAADTTIVLSGDHLGMQTDFYSQFTAGSPAYQRTVYNVFINPAAHATQTQQFNRQFSTMDLYPTTLAALGVSIDGNHLGLGTNLFSDEKTLVERYGRGVLDEDLGKNSVYYDKHILTKH